MKRNVVQKTVLVTAILLLTGAIAAFAQGGYGRGCGFGMMSDDDRGEQWYCPGAYGGDGMMRGGNNAYMRGRGCGYGSGLSEETIAGLDAERERFFNETKALREQISDRRLALREEMIKNEPDAEKIAGMQKELSDLQAQFDQKRIRHQLAMRGLMPEEARARGCGRGCGRGYGGGGGRGGGRGGGNGWQ